MNPTLAANAGPATKSQRRSMANLRSPVFICDPFALAMLFAVLAIPFSLAKPVMADTVASDATQIGPSAQRLRNLSNQLGSSRFSRRRAAGMTLKRMGAAAHPTLGRIAVSGEANAAAQAIDLLRAALHDDDPQISESARTILNQIADSKQAVARSARLALSPNRANQSGDEFAVPLLQPMPRIVAPAFAPARPARVRINIRNVNGVREITVIQNQDRFKFRDAGKGLEVECPDGLGGVKKFTCRDEKELQKKDMRAFRAYQSAGGAKAGRAGVLKVPPPPK